MAEGDLKHDLSQRNTGDHICQHMLTGKQRGETDKDRKNKGKDLVPYRNTALTEDSPKTDPAFQTVNGGKQVQGRIQMVNKPQQP